MLRPFNLLVQHFSARGPGHLIVARLDLSTSGEQQEVRNTNNGQSEFTALNEVYWKPPTGLVKPPWYRRVNVQRPNFLHDETMSAADESLSGWRLWDYYKIQEIVNWLPTIKEKIDFVNPYERAWRRREKTWHRRWMPHLMAQRGAWQVPPIPRYFDALDFYKHITKTRLVEGEEAQRAFAAYYKGLSLPTTQFEKRVAENLAMHLEKEAQAEQENHPEEERTEGRARFLQSLVRDAHLVLSHGNTRLLEHRISFTDRCESFWVRAGFRHLYEYLPVWETDKTEVRIRKSRFSADDRRKLGELCFTMRDKLAAQVRVSKPIKNLFDWSDRAMLEAPIFTTPDYNLEELLLSPGIYNLSRDKEPLWQCPGYEYDSSEPRKFGKFAVKDVSALFHQIDNMWRCESEAERTEVAGECLAATAIATLFNWLNGQAHCLGHTQYTEIESPLTAQLVLSDAKRLFYFAIGQLNTIAINMEVEGFNNRRTNTCCVEGPFYLYDAFDKETSKFWYKDSSDGELREGLNPHVLERILQMCTVY